MQKLISFLILIFGVVYNVSGIDSLFYDPNFKYSQEDVDSIIQYDLITKSNYEYFEDILRGGDLKGWHWFYYYEGKVKHESYDLESARLSFEKGLSLLEGTYETMNEQDFECRLQIKTALGSTLSHLGKFKESIIVLQEAKEDAKYLEFSNKGFVTAGIAINHFMLGNDSIAYPLIKEVSTDSVYMSYPANGIFVWNTLAVLNQEEENERAAIYSFKQALDLAERSGYHVHDLDVSMNLVSIYWTMDSMDMVERYLKIAEFAIENYDQPPRQYFEEYEKKAIGQLRIVEGEIDYGIELLKEVIDTVIINGIKDKSHKAIVTECYYALVYGYKKQMKYDKAMEAMEDLYVVERSYAQFQLDEQLQQLEVQYETKQKDQSISTLKDQAIEQSETISRQRLLSVVGGALVLLIGVIGVLIYRQRLLGSKYKEANLQQRLLRTQMDPHFVYNSLNSVSSLIYQKSDMAIPYVSKLASLLRQILENSRQELVPLGDEINALESYLSLESNFGKTFGFNIDTQMVDPDLYLVPPMLIQPFVENSIKHGFKGIENPLVNLNIYSSSDKGLLEVTIVDNGVGLSATDNKSGHNSLATSIVKERLEIFGKQYNVDCQLKMKNREPENGTEIMISIPFVLDDH